jgi:F0F1-type ATP synthase membrane subunit a
MVSLTLPLYITCFFYVFIINLCPGPSDILIKSNTKISFIMATVLYVLYIHQQC